MDIYKGLQEKRQEQIDRVNSICYVGGQQISKGIIDDMAYDKEKFPVKKKGSEIISKLEEEYKSSEMDKKICLKEMLECVKELTIRPSCPLDSYNAKEYEDQLGFVPYRYGHEQIYGGNMDDMETKETIKPNDEQKSKMREYNRLLNKYIDKCIDMIKLKVAIMSIDKNKSYIFSIEQASKLGF